MFNISRPGNAFMKCLILSLALAIGFVPPAAMAQSQATTGVIEGTVSDESGSALPGVTVTLENTATHFEQVEITDARGRFRGALLPLGPYRVTAELDGFKTWVRGDMRLTVGRTIDLDIMLQLSTVEE